ncbi:hypothetical protein [Mycobacterium deserti]|uniref:Uncharacterized protein n=1 Tax=Mycobacterium deserti TaxID=2978347 RepID=A0ABT2MA12_9MYCO|nr:hypothetical protein [Mycobacterium deserti]MCT7658005.1 hypothetical protein [Mycobacterium deserti]
MFDAAGDRRQQAIEATRGALTGAFTHGYLDELRVATATTNSNGCAHTARTLSKETLLLFLDAKPITR